MCELCATCIQSVVNEISAFTYHVGVLVGSAILNNNPCSCLSQYCAGFCVKDLGKLCVLLVLCRGESSSRKWLRAVMRNFKVFFAVGLQSSCRQFEKLWRSCNVTVEGCMFPLCGMGNVHDDYHYLLLLQCCSLRGYLNYQLLKLSIYLQQ